MIERKVFEKGICPYCNSDEVEYGETILEDNQLGYKVHCNHCNHDSIEWYELNYIETVGKE